LPQAPYQGTVILPLNRFNRNLFTSLKVGSIHERDDERGYTHLIELLCSLGTANYNNRTLKRYLESIGVDIEHISKTRLDFVEFGWSLPAAEELGSEFPHIDKAVSIFSVWLTNFA